MMKKEIVGGTDQKDNFIQEYGHLFVSTKVFYGSMRDIAAYGIIAQANEMATKGVSHAAFQVQIAIPMDMDKSRMNSIRNHTKGVKEILENQGFGVDMLQITTGRSAGLRVPAVTVTAIGKSEKKELFADALLTARAGQDVILMGYVGLEGMLRIVGEKESALRERFTPAFIRQMKSYDGELCQIRSIRQVSEEGVTVIRQISEGGILEALWNLALETEKGISLDMKKFTIKQETIEACEYFRLNPYQLTSNGSFLMVADGGEELVERLKEKGIMAAVIGQLTDTNDKIIQNGEDMRYIDRPAPDDLYKII